MPGKLKGKAIVVNSIPTSKLETPIAEAVESGIVPKISSLTYANSNTYILTGSGFDSNASVYIGNVLASTVTHTNSNSVAFTVASNTSFGIYNVFLINSDGGVAVYPNLEVSNTSGAPVWTTNSILSPFQLSNPISYQLTANSNTTITYTLQAGSSLPGGITLAANGLLSGTLTSVPNALTTYAFIVLATDQENQFSARQFSVTGS